MKRWRLITICWTEWGVIWIHRGVLSGTVDKFKMVFETKSRRRLGTLVASFVALFLLVYYLTREKDPWVGYCSQVMRGLGCSRRC